jgi:hypothetical protein
MTKRKLVREPSGHSLGAVSVRTHHLNPLEIPNQEINNNFDNVIVEVCSTWNLVPTSWGIDAFYSLSEHLLHVLVMS